MFNSLLVFTFDYTKEAKSYLNYIKFISYEQELYVPRGFTFKRNSKLQDGAKNIYTLSQLIKT